MYRNFAKNPTEILPPLPTEYFFKKASTPLYIKIHIKICITTLLKIMAEILSFVFQENIHSIKIPFVMEIFPEKFIDDDIKKECLISFRFRLAIPAISTLKKLRLNP